MNELELAREGDRFYQELVPFTDFVEITKDRHFRSVPGDWWVVITDVKGSTQAIEAGKYKDVNTIGAATIVAIQNALKGTEFPYVFGGDGATLLIPPECLDVVTRKLSALKNLSVRNFGLELRAGIVAVSEILNGPATIEVAKFELVPGKSVAILRGGGLTEAEKLVKGCPENYEIADSDSTDLDLGGLSCRWRDIPNRSGRVLSMLVAANEKQSNPSQVYLDLLDEMRTLSSSNLMAFNPVELASMNYCSTVECIRNEKRFHPGFSLSWLLRYLEIISTNLVFRWKHFPKWLTPRHYLNSMRVHSDYRKFDDMLRMVIDCSPGDIEKLRTYLDREYRQGYLFYGLHESENSLMTCYVQSIRDGDHIHFIDGGDGGYAMAAKQLKAQMKA